jgi:hypothetical protein
MLSLLQHRFTLFASGLAECMLQSLLLNNQVVVVPSGVAQADIEQFRPVQCGCYVCNKVLSQAC